LRLRALALFVALREEVHNKPLHAISGFSSRLEGRRALGDHAMQTSASFLRVFMLQLDAFTHTHKTSATTDFHLDTNTICAHLWMLRGHLLLS